MGKSLMNRPTPIQSGNAQVPTPGDERVTTRHGHLGLDPVGFCPWTDAHMEVQARSEDKDRGLLDESFGSGEQCQLILGGWSRPLSTFIRSCRADCVAK